MDSDWARSSRLRLASRTVHPSPVYACCLNHHLAPVVSSPSSIVTWTSSKRRVTRSARWASNDAASLLCRATPIAYIPPALAAAMPAGASSTTKQRLGTIPNAAAAARKSAGSGLPRGTSRPFTFASNRSSSVTSPVTNEYCIPCAAANAPTEMARRNSSAFLDDEAEQTWTPAAFTSNRNRTASW